MASPATIARDLRDARFQDALRIPPAIDPTAMQASSGADAQGIDGLRSSSVGNTPGVNSASQNSDQAQFAESLQGRGAMARYQQLKQMRHSMQARRAVGKDVFRAAFNKTYAREVDIVQSELISNILALEVFISPWIFLLAFSLRVIGGNLLHIRFRGIEIYPPYTLKGGGIGVLLSHLGITLLILLVLAIISTIVALVAIFVTQPVWEQVKTIINLGTTGLQVLFDLVTS